MARGPWREVEPGVREVDLHGMERVGARQIVTATLDACRQDGTRLLRIIHGKGTGVLRDEVRLLLDGHGAVDDYRYARPRDGGEGATEVKFRRGR